MAKTFIKQGMVVWKGQLLDYREFSGKTVAVVGNSNIVRRTEEGAYIDKFDMVMRFNAAFPRKALYKHLGSRTTHMSYLVREYNEKHVRKPGIVHYLTEPPEQVYPGLVKVPALPLEASQGWRMQMKTHKEPSSGARLIWWLLNCCTCRDIALFGFDGLKTHDWNRRPGFKHYEGHSPDLEKQFLWQVATQVFLCPHDLVTEKKYRAGD